MGVSYLIIFMWLFYDHHDAGAGGLGGGLMGHPASCLWLYDAYCCATIYDVVRETREPGKTRRKKIASSLPFLIASPLTGRVVRRRMVQMTVWYTLRRTLNFSSYLDVKRLNLSSSFYLGGCHGHLKCLGLKWVWEWERENERSGINELYHYHNFH